MSNKPNAAPIHYLRIGMTYCALLLVRSLLLFPYRWQMSIGKLLGLLLMKSSRRRHIARTNLKTCFPELSETEIKALLRSHFISLGKGFVETNLAWWGDKHRIESLFSIEGLEYLDRALERSNGVILLSAHFTTLEIGIRILAHNLPYRINALYRQHTNPVYETEQKNGRDRYIGNPIPREDVRQMVKRLKNNEVVWYAQDQNYGHKHSVFANFFGVPAATNTTTSRLAKLTGAAVVPFFQTRRLDGSGYDLKLLPPLENFPSDSIEEDTQRINKLIESEVRNQPEQYLWVHRRFKDRPPGQPDLYQRTIS